MNDTFNALNKEAQFTSEMLCSGYNQLRNANSTTKGVYFQAFTSLSTGIERIGKIIILLDSAISNNGNFPDNNFIQYKLKHDITKVYKFIEDIKEKFNFELKYLRNLNQNIYKDILEILSNFGSGDRYSNINLLVKNKKQSDPINQWYEKVDKYIINNDIKHSKMKKITEQAEIDHVLFSDISSIHHTDENNEEVNTFFDFSIKNKINEKIGMYRRLYVYRIIRYYVEMLFQIENKIRANDVIQVPYFWDIFRIFNCDDGFPKSRKIINII